MKIVIDARESGTSTGRYVDKLIEYLHQLKPEYEIVILAKASRLEYLAKIAPDLKIVESNYREFTFAEQLGLARQIRRLKPDVVHFAMTQQPILSKGRVVTTIHDLTTLRFDNPSKNWLVFKFKQRVYGWVIKKVARKSKFIITPSNYVAQDVARYANISLSKIFVTHEAADKISAPAQAVPRLAGKQFIMYVGRATPHKNLERLVKTFEILKDKHPQLMLALAGKTDANYRRLGALVSNKHLAHSIVFTDFVSEGQLRWLYENTAAYVFPSLSEGFGLPGLEAMAHGAPVLSSSATCLPEIYGDGAHYFDPQDTADMAAKIDEVITSQAVRADLIKKGQAQAAKYSWARMATQTLAVYQRALK